MTYGRIICMYNIIPVVTTHAKVCVLYLKKCCMFFSKYHGVDVMYIVMRHYCRYTILVENYQETHSAQITIIASVICRPHFACIAYRKLNTLLYMCVCTCYICSYLFCRY